MSRETWIWDKAARGGKGDLVPKDQYLASSESRGIMVIRDIEPYRSVIDRSVIGGRKQHRDHLRAHGCVELGNSVPKPQRQEMPRAGYDIKRALGE